MPLERNVSLQATEQQKQAFELELRMYDGDDPLDVWDRYIKWIEHSNAKSNLGAVLERAVQQFVDEKKFYDDPRYVDIWIKLAQNSTQPLNMFSYMQNQGIGVQQAALYTAWSDALEMQGDLQQAEIIFLEGLKSGARPLDELQRHYRTFQSRLSGLAHRADVTQEKKDLELQLPSTVGRRTRRNRRVLASVNTEEGSSAGHSSTTDYQPSTSGLIQSMSVSVFDESQARSVEPAVIDAKENQSMWQKTDNMMCSSGDVTPQSGPGATHTQNTEEPPHASDDVPLAPEQGSTTNQCEDQQRVQSMFCKELLFRGPMEFCFEELRAERYFASTRQKLRDKQMYLGKEKERLSQLIEQRLQAKSTLGQEHSQEKFKPFKVDNGSANPATESGPPGENAPRRNDEVFLLPGETAASERPSPRPTAADVQPKPFAVFDENSPSGLPLETFSAPAPAPSHHKSLKLPMPTLRTRGSPSDPPVAERDSKDRTLSEEAIINSHRNKTLSRSPDDTYDFAHAAVLVSTPFGGVRGQSEGGVTDKPQGSCPNTTPQTPTEPTEASKLSPILEVSQEWRSISAVPRQPDHSVGSASSASVVMEPVVMEPVPDEDDMELQETAAPPEAQPTDPCSLEVRRRLLHEIGLRNLPNLHPEPGPLPSTILGLRLGDQLLHYLMKMSNLEDYYLLPPDEQCTVLKVERCPVPWDFYICSQLNARLPADTQGHFLNESSCFLFEDGCVTLWTVPREFTLAEITADTDDKPLVAHLALRLVEMVRRMHTCHLVHGALRPHSLIFYPSPTDSDLEHAVVMAIDFSSSLDLKFQPEVQSVGLLSNAAEFISQGLLLPTSSPYQLDLLGVAETVHLMLFKRRLEVAKTETGWRLADTAETSEGSLHAIWHKFFQKILNSGEKSATSVLTELHEDLRDYIENVVGFYKITSNII
ncbi:mitotic checkpoint serine/threonine-protein kinase BUB1 beta [Clupea harengus]|uniref:Mitotic checkpoint serine/threonine-protein kinase BUB1 beta n=1 Tax=Clupea harengus TaxID=7950 RepID=A0A6P8GDN4_CLUHA|nr:mitotic checkpoint serine/threonine-protein kinase BUB1 beta [Clupea harengus]XP_031437283.1 mitotic checkpoint serine/threonine-protein kinase BUB1 beta [Clupea harengus]XP_031437284.1 mitotic checkpoint serine/threonine-protein kinase BUB1 beta [Clupea harengus]